ncbi:MAG TPA: DapH/DapD/GlmU-related protein [Pirellulales bacterium]|nr:DapH/DapD/GlmU-related protein [Pirellulales bacterium]
MTISRAFPTRLRRWAKPWVVRCRGAHVPVVGPLRWAFGGGYALHVAAREAIALIAKFCWYEPLWRSQCAEVGRNFQMEQLPYLFGQGRIVLGANVRLSGKSSIIFSDRNNGPPILRVGDGTFIGHNCSLHIADAVTIGVHCLIAGGVRISDNDGHPLDPIRRRRNEAMPREAIRPVSIGDDVWIGAGAQVLKGVTIGDRSVVGAGAIVTRDVPSDVVVAGNPARVVKRLTTEAETHSLPHAQIRPRDARLGEAVSIHVASNAH